METMYKFLPGSYPFDSLFIKSVMILKQSGGGWDKHFVLINPELKFDNESEASEATKTDLKDAYLKVKDTGRERAMAEYLSAIGYCKLEED